MFVLLRLFQVPQTHKILGISQVTVATPLYLFYVIQLCDKTHLSHPKFLELLHFKLFFTEL